MSSRPMRWRAIATPSRTRQRGSEASSLSHVITVAGSISATLPSPAVPQRATNSSVEADMRHRRARSAPPPPAPPPPTSPPHPPTPPPPPPHNPPPLPSPPLIPHPHHPPLHPPHYTPHLPYPPPPLHPIAPYHVPTPHRHPPLLASLHQL